MKIIIKNGSLVFEKREYITVLLDDSNVEINSCFIKWSTGEQQTQPGKGVFPLFPYKGGDITLTHMNHQSYDIAVICFYTDEGETYVQFAGPGGPTTNGLKDYVTGVYGNNDIDYFIPEKDIVALGDIKYFRIGSLNWPNFGKATVKYKITEPIE